MERMFIAYEVSDKTAIRLGMEESGAGEFPLGKVLPLLSAETLAWLEDAWTSPSSNLRKCAGTLKAGPTDSSSWPLTLDAAPSPESIARAIEDVRCAWAKKMAKAQAEEEDRICRALAMPDAAWLNTGEGSVNAPRVLTDGPKGLYLCAHAMHDARVVAHVERLNRDVLPEYTAAYETWCAKKQAEQALAQSQTQSQIERLAAETAERRANMRAWVLANERGLALASNLVRAACEGIDVTRALRGLVRAEVHAAMTAAGLDTVINPRSSRVDKRVPTLRAYEVRDRVMSARSTIASAALLPGVQVSVGAFERFDLARDKNDRCVLRTGIRLSVTHLWFPDEDFGRIVLTEPLAYDAAKEGAPPEK